MINYRFCPQCKKPLRKVNGSPRCQVCDITIYNNPAPTVGVLPVKNSKVLLARRAIEPFKGALDTIGGFLENNELPEAGALREAKEETGADLEIVEFLGFFTDVYLPGEYTLAMNYIAKLKNPNTELRPADDVASLHWVSINKPPLQETGFKTTQEALLRLKGWYEKTR